MARGALAQSVAIHLEHEDDVDADRFVDLCVSFRICDVDPVTRKWIPETDEELLEVGGRWDRRKKRWDEGESKTLCVIRVHRGQEAAARELADWLRRRASGPWRPGAPEWEGFKRYWTMLLVGGRRGGKSHLAVIALILFLVMMPRCRLFAVSPTLERGDELEDAVKSLLPRSWYKYRGGGSGKPTQFRLIHGGRLLAVSGHKQGNLKAGRVDMALYNEGQQMSKKGWIQLRGSTSDRGGLTIVTANPPDTPIGRWIEETYESSLTYSQLTYEQTLDQVDVKKASASFIKSFTLTARDNPFVTWESLADLEADAKDDREYRREVLGEFVPIGDVVLHAWRDELHWQDPDPKWIDITVEFSRRELGVAGGYLALMDFQSQPAMVTGIAKIFRDPSDPDREILAIVDEAYVELADEYQLLDKLESTDRWTPAGRVEEGYRGWRNSDDDRGNPVHCVVVMDATGFHQDGAHSKGRTSELALRSRRWTFLFKPQKDSDANPDVLERCKVTNARLKSASGKVRVVVAKHCVHTARSMRLWELKNGFPYKRSDHAHLCDAIGYGIYRFWGRPKVKRSAGTYEGAKRYTRADEMKGIIGPR